MVNRLGARECMILVIHRPGVQTARMPISHRVAIVKTVLLQLQNKACRQSTKGVNTHPPVGECQLLWVRTASMVV